jgi:hypothetical protein
MFSPLQGQDHTNVMLSFAQFDIFKQHNTVAETRMEIRQEFASSYINPLVGVMANFDGARFFYMGVYFDWMLLDGLYVTPSFAPGFYSQGRSKNLHFMLEFRSQLDLSLHISNRLRVGVNINHISNASLSSLNPGVESFAFYILIPFKSVL